MRGYKNVITYPKFVSVENAFLKQPLSPIGLEDFHGEDSQDLIFTKAEILTIIEIETGFENYWIGKKSSGQIGLVPVSYIDIVESTKIFIIEYLAHEEEKKDTASNTTVTNGKDEKEEATINEVNETINNEQNDSYPEGSRNEKEQKITNDYYKSQSKVSIEEYPVQKEEKEDIAPKTVVSNPNSDKEEQEEDMIQDNNINNSEQVDSTLDRLREEARVTRFSSVFNFWQDMEKSKK